MAEAPHILGSTDAGEPLSIDLDRLIGSHACIVANSGGGKSGLIRRLLEETHGYIQHIVLDVEDEFYTLRERFDYVIAGGDGGDAPASLETAESLALATLTHGFSLIAQLNDLGPDAPAFVGRFLEALIGAPRELWRPVLVVLDEAQRFAPNKDGKKTDATPGVKALTAQGRKRGFTAVLASQRIAKIDPNVRGDINNWMLGRVGQALDRRTMADELGFAPSSIEARGLQGLPDRTFWGFGPAISRDPVLFRVRDVRTTPVRPGQTKIPTPPPADALREILAGLATEVEEQKIETAIAAFDDDAEAGQLLVAKDELIADLESEAAGLRSELEHLRGIRDDAERYRLSAEAAIEILEEVRRARPLTFEPQAPISEVPAGGADSLAAGQSGRAETEEPLTSVSASPRTEAGALRGRKALDALVARNVGLTERQWAWVAGFSIKGGTWGTYRSALRAAGLVEERDGRWWPTDAGYREASEDPPAFPAFGHELARASAKKISGVSKMIETLLKRWPHFTTRDGLAADLGMAASGGTFRTYLGRLRSAGMLEEHAKRLRLNPELMERG